MKKSSGSNADFGYFFGGFIVILILILSGVLSDNENRTKQENANQNKIDEANIDTDSFPTFSNRGMTRRNFAANYKCDGGKTFTNLTISGFLSHNYYLSIHINTGENAQEVLKIVDSGRVDANRPDVLLKKKWRTNHYFHGAIFRGIWTAQQEISEQEWYERLKISAPNYYQLITKKENDCIVGE